MNDPRAEVVKKALTDPTFKAALLKDAKSAIEKAAGVKLPAGLSIKIVEDNASVVHLVLPAAPAKGALTDNELNAVSGGADFFNPPMRTTPGCCDSSTPMPQCR